MTKARILVALIVLLAPAAVLASSMTMAAPTAELKKCDTLHHEQTCNRYHVVEAKPSLDIGTELVLEDPTGIPGTYVVQGLQLVHNLADGSQVVEPVSSFNANGSFAAPITLVGEKGQDSKVVQSRLKLEVVRK